MPPASFPLVLVPVDVAVAVDVAEDPLPEEVPVADPVAPVDAPEVAPEVDPELPEPPDEPEVDVFVDVPVDVCVLVGAWLPDADPLLSFEVEPHAAAAVTSTMPEPGKKRMLLKDLRRVWGEHARSLDSS